MDFLLKWLFGISTVDADTLDYQNGEWLGFIIGLGCGAVIILFVWLRSKYIIRKFDKTKRGFWGSPTEDCQSRARSLMNYLSIREKQAKHGWLRGDGVPVGRWHEIDSTDKASHAFLSQFIFRLRRLGLDMYVYEIGKLDTMSDEEIEEEGLGDIVKKTRAPHIKRPEPPSSALYTLLLLVLSSASLMALAAFLLQHFNL